MDVIYKMLTGQIEMFEFIAQLKINEELRHDLSNLITQEARCDPNCTLWEGIWFYALKPYDFNMLKFIESNYRFDGSIEDNYNIFGAIRAVYCYFHSDTICTKNYENAFLLYLDIVRDCFDGPDVRNLIERIVANALMKKNKKQQREYGKNAIKTIFHVESANRYPRWINGPEWPMGKSSPMRFIYQKSSNESVKYYFEDVDSGENMIVQQHY